MQALTTEQIRALIARGKMKDTIFQALGIICLAIGLLVILLLVITLRGGLTLMQEGESVDDAVKRADLLLYQAKSGGRDRIVVDLGREALGLGGISPRDPRYDELGQLPD